MQYIEYETLEKIAVITRGVSWKSGEESSEKSFDNIRAYKIPHIIKNKKYVSEYEPLYIKKYKKHEAKLIAYNDILMITSNGNPDRVGNISLYKSREIAVPASFLLKIRGKEVVVQEFLYYFLSSDQAQSNITGNIAGSTGLRNINMASLKGLKVPIPPIKEQQKIAEILSTVDEQIEQTDQLIEKTKELKKGLLQQLLTKGIGHTEFKQSEIGEIPVEWDLKKIGEICTFSQGLQVPVEEQYDDDGDDKVQFLRIVDYTQNNAQPRYIKKTEKKYFISKEDLIMIRYGNPGFVGIGREGVIANNMFKIIPEFGNITTRYLYIYLSQKNIKLKIKKMSTSTTMPAISFKTIADLPIVIPTINEQQKIAEIISSVDEDIEGYEEEKLKYEELKKGLMQQLLTGKTRLKVD